MRYTHTLAMASLWLERLKTHGLTGALMVCAACKAGHRSNWARAAVVSSLPSRSLPQALREAMQASIEGCWHKVPGSRLIQFTYLPRVLFVATADFQ